MLTSKRRALMVAFLVGLPCLIAGFKARAGAKVTTNVVINTSGLYAYGSMGSARNSADANQYIGCGVDAYDNGSYYGFCYAVDSVGTFVGCHTSNAALITAITATTTDTRIYFAWTASTGQCNQIESANFSYNPPRAP